MPNSCTARHAIARCLMLSCVFRRLRSSPLPLPTPWYNAHQPHLEVLHMMLSHALLLQTALPGFGALRCANGVAAAAARLAEIPSGCQTLSGLLCLTRADNVDATLLLRDVACVAAMSLQVVEGVWSCVGRPNERLVCRLSACLHVLMSL